MRVSTSITRGVVWGLAAVVLSTTAVALVPSASWAAVNVFVKFDELGPCGGSLDQRFEGFLEATSFRFVLEGPKGKPGAAVRPAKFITSQAMQIVALPGGCSPQFFLSALSGRLLTLNVTFFDPQADGGFAPLEILATGVILQGLDLSGAPGQQGQEIITLGVGNRVTITTRSSPMESPASQCWDFARNETC